MSLDVANRASRASKVLDEVEQRLSGFEEPHIGEQTRQSHGQLIVLHSEDEGPVSRESLERVLLDLNVVDSPQLEV